jgi:hypothetical protein
MVRFAEGLEAGRVLPRAALERMWTEAATRDGVGVHYGLGWGIEGVDGHFEVSHGGAQQETRTYLLHVPSRHFTVAVATNLENARPSLFADRAAALWLGGTRSLRLDAPGAADRARLAALQGVFDEGLAYYDRHGTAAGAAPAEVAAAFRYFAEVVRAERLAALAGEDRMLKQGRDPVAGRPWAVAGSHMVQALITAGRGRLEEYQSQGPLRLFADYVALCRGGGRVAAAARLPREMEARVVRWAAEWPRVWDADPLLAVLDARDLDRLEAARARWAAAGVRPRYESDLVALAESSAEEGDAPLALRAARLAVELYPDSKEAAAALQKATAGVSSR